MKLLLDESLPRRLEPSLPGHEVTTVPLRGWAGKKNGELLELASREFDVFSTADQNLPYQQRLADYDIAVVVLAGRTNRLEDLRPLIPKVLETLGAVRPGTVMRIAS